MHRSARFLVAISLCAAISPVGARAQESVPTPPVQQIQGYGDTGGGYEQQPPQYTQQQAYPQQAYPQQAYPQQAYPQQAYPGPGYGYGAPAACPANSEFQPNGREGQGCYHVIHVDRPNPALFWIGLPMFLVGYVFQVSYGIYIYDNFGTENARNFMGASFVPLAGPFISMAFDRYNDSVLGVGLLGAAQLVGALLVTLAHAFPDQRVALGPRVAFTGDRLVLEF